MDGSAVVSSPLPQIDARTASEVARLRSSVVPRRKANRSPPGSPGAIRGAVNLVDTGRIAGWAQDAEHPDSPVQLEVLVDGRVVAHALADRYREELRRAGIGRGEHGFEVALPPGLSSGGKLIVRRVTDGAEIDGLPDSVNARIWRRTLKHCGAASPVPFPE